MSLGWDHGRARGRRVAIITLALGVAGAGAVSCSAKHDPAPGELLLAVDSNLKVPDDIDEIGIAVASADGKVVTTDKIYGMAPTGDAKFPATLAIIRGTSGPIDIKVAGYKSGSAFALRETVTTIPEDRTAILRVDLNWLDNHTATGSGATGSSVRSLTGTCGDGQTSVAGTCSSFTLDSVSLGTFASDALVPSDDTSACVNVTDCILGGGLAGGAVTVPASALTGGTAASGAAQCTIVPPGVAGAFNVGLVLAPGGDGWCNATSCVIPLENDPVEGWQLGADGMVALPASVCTNAKIASLVFTPVGDACPQYTATHPACQNYGKDGGTVAPGAEAGPAMDATTGSDATAGDAGPLADGSVTSDGGPVVVNESFGIGGYTFIGLAANPSETTFMALVRPQDGGGTQIATYTLDPASGELDEIGPLLPLPVDPSATAIDMAAGDGVFAVATQEMVQTFVAPTNAAPTTLIDAGVFTNSSTTPSSLIYLPEDGGARLTFGNVNNPFAIGSSLVWQQPSGAFTSESVSPGPVSGLAYDPVSGNYAIAEENSAFSTNDPAVITVTTVADPAPASHTPAVTESMFATTAVAFASTDTIAFWLVNANEMPELHAALATAAGSMPPAIQQTTGLYTGPHSMVGGGGRIFYIGYDQHIYRVNMNGGGATSAPFDEQALLGTTLMATQLGLTATHLLYTDGARVYRYPLKDVP